MDQIYTRVAATAELINLIHITADTVYDLVEDSVRDNWYQDAKANIPRTLVTVTMV